MKMKDVEAMVVKSSQAYAAPTGAEESHGIGYMLVIKVTTDKGLTGYSDVETQPHVAKAVIDAPAGGAGLIDGLRQAVLGEDPIEVEKLWYNVQKQRLLWPARCGHPGSFWD